MTASPARRPVRSFLLVVVALCATPARADTFEIYLRDLAGKPLNGAQVWAFKIQDPSRAATVDNGTARANFLLGDLLSGPLSSGATGLVTMTIDPARQDPNDHSIVFVARRVGEGVTAVVPFIVNLGFDLRLMSSVSGVSSIPTSGKDLVIVADVKGVLHFRTFDADGKVVVDTDETRLTTQAGPIADLKRQLDSVRPPHELTRSEKDRVIAEVTSIVDHPLNLGTQTLNIAVPEQPQVPPCVALPQQPCVAPPPPVYYYYQYYQVPTHRHHGLHSRKR